MASYTGRSSKPYSYSPSAPPAPPDPTQPHLAFPYHPPPPSHSSSSSSSSSFGSGHFPPPQSQGYGGSYPYPPPEPPQSGWFPAGTHPDVIRSFEMVDRNRNGYIEETELQEALSRTYHKFSRRTLRLLIFLFRNSSESFSRIGPKEFAEVWNCLKQWRAIFERFDRDQSGRIDAVELRDALYSLGYAVPPSVLQVLISKYDDGSGRRVELNFDSFVECGMIVKGLTEKFKQKDPGYTGSATLTYDSFMSMIIPFLVSD